VQPALSKTEGVMRIFEFIRNLLGLGRDVSMQEDTEVGEFDAIRPMQQPDQETSKNDFSRKDGVPYPYHFGDRRDRPDRGLL
jgi:hypothetical protein